MIRVVYREGRAQCVIAMQQMAQSRHSPFPRWLNTDGRREGDTVSYPA